MELRNKITLFYFYNHFRNNHYITVLCFLFLGGLCSGCFHRTNYRNILHYLLDTNTFLKNCFGSKNTFETFYKQVKYILYIYMTDMKSNVFYNIKKITANAPRVLLIFLI